MTTLRMSTRTEEVLRSVIHGDPYHMQFSPLLNELDYVRAERDRANRILAALREPSEGVVDETRTAWIATPWHRNFWQAVIRAAVAAAEQEVGRA